MLTSAEQLPTNQKYNHELRVYNDTISWCAEALNGSMRTPEIPLPYDHEDIYGPDGGSLTAVFDRAVEAAMVIASRRPDQAFELRRRLIEREELDDMRRLLADTSLNTMVIVSDYPPELQYTNEDVAGYNGRRKQTMLRLVEKRSNGELIMHSQSLDRSDRTALEAIYTHFGVSPQAGELLGQRLLLQLDEAEQLGLMDRLSAVYDQSLANRFGGSWHAGIRQTGAEAAINTYAFAIEQHDLIDWFMTAKQADLGADESLRLQLAATMHARYEKALQATNTTLSAQLGMTAVGRTMPSQNLQTEMMLATAIAIEQGIPFSGCGISVGGGGASAESVLGLLGYGGMGAEDQFGPLTFKCPNGHDNIRPHGTLIPECTTCKVSVAC